MIAGLALLGLQGTGADDWARSMVRRSAAIAQREQREVEARARAASAERRRAALAQAARNREAGERARASRKTLVIRSSSQTAPVARRLPEVVSDTKEVSYVANVTIPIVGDDSKPAAEVDVVATVGNDPRPVPCRSTERGIYLERVALPARINVRPADPDGAWSARSTEGESIDVEIPQGDPHRYARGVETIVSRAVVSRKNDGRRILSQTLTQAVQALALPPTDPIVLRRELVRFVLPRDGLPVAIRAVRPAVHLGDEPLVVREAPSGWSFEARRDRLPPKDARFVARFDTPNADFAGELSASRADPYEENAVAPGEMGLEAIPEGAITLSGKPVGTAFPLSPLHWVSPAGEVRLTTGRMALDLLGVTESLPTGASRPPGRRPLRWIQVPDPSGRFGLWIWLEDLGLGLHCRWAEDESRKDRRAKGGRFLPERGSLGILESIRVLSPEGGSVGSALCVGRARSEILEAFGKVDVPDLDAAKVMGNAKGSERDRAITGDARIEAWDDSFLDGGIRAKWDGDRLKWFEIVRPAGLLYNGTRSFEPPERRKVHVRSVTSEGDGKTDTQARLWVERLLKESSGVVQTDSPEGADLVLDLRFTARNAGGVRDSDFTVTAFGGDGTTEKKAFSVKGGPSSTRRFANAMAEIADIVGTVVAVNYETGSILINLGTKNGIRAKSEEEGTEFAMYLLYDVDPTTGRHLGDIDDEAIVGKHFKEWLEVQRVGPDWCVAKPKVKGSLKRTETAKEVISRLIDPGSGLVRVRVVAKRGH